MEHTIDSPETFFGFTLGSDGNIARWDRIVTYYQQLAEQSGRVKVIDLGPSTEGNPFLLVIITAPENLAKLERLRTVNARLADPRGLAEEEIRALVGEGKAVICQSMSLHASEISGTQMAPELAYDLLTRDDEETRRILENVVFLMIPSFNPDGQIMVTDWYRQHAGTEFEGCRLPWLYHRYAGHDNNRDAFMTNLVESQYVAKLMFREWHPHAYQDHHEMGSYAARFYVAPYSEPIHPHGDPLVWRELSWYGAHIAYKLEEAGKTGVLNRAVFAGWCHMGFHWIGIYHNIASMLTEAASAKLATPLYIHPAQLSGDGAGTHRAFPHYKPQTNFPNPWEGGWWRLRDLIEYQKVAAWALLDLAARHRETVLWNAVRKAQRQTERAASDPVAAYVIPPAQHDPPTAAKLVEKLLGQGLDLQRATADFIAGEVTYAAGSILVPLAQPKRGLIHTLLGRTRYPDDAWTRRPDGTPVRPYDTATDTFAEFMGVRVDAIPALAGARLEPLTFLPPFLPSFPPSSLPPSAAYLLDPRLNDSFRVVNTLLQRGVPVTRLDAPVTAGDLTLPPGAFRVPAEAAALLQETAGTAGVPVHSVAAEPEGRQRALKPPRIAMYQRYWGGNMDEGWTRLVLEQFGFPYTSVKDDVLKQGNLNAAFDVLLLPSDSGVAITGDEERAQDETVPPGYRSGIGDEGVAAIKQFVQEGGTLVALNQACGFAIEKLGLKIENLLQDRPTREFFCPGSTLKAAFDTTHPLAYGMPREGLLFHWDSPTFRIKPSPFNDRYAIVARYPERDLLQSGWLSGEEKIAHQAAVVCARHGQGRVVLFGCRPQHRAQTHGTFKLLFNALLLSATAETGGVV